MYKEIKIEQYFKDINRFKRISVKRERELSLIIHGKSTPQEIDDAKKELIESNLLLVVNRASKIYRQNSMRPLMDLIAEGNIALINACNRYDVAKYNNVVFSTFAVKLIDQYIYKCIKKDRFVRIPEPQFPILCKIKKMKEEYGENLTDDMLIKKLKIPSSYLKRLTEGIHYRVLSLEEIEHDEKLSWENILTDINSPDPSKETNLIMLRNYISKCFVCLSEKEKIVLNEVFFSEKNPTLKEVASVIGVSRERARQIYIAGLERLKKHFENEWGLNIKPILENKTDVAKMKNIDIIDYFCDIR